MATFEQETDNDLKLVEGQLVLVTKNSEAAAIQLKNRFQFVLGEWFLDTQQGVPYFAYVFVKNPDVLLIRQLFRTIILGTPGITSVPEITVDYVASSRTCTFSFRAVTDEGLIITGGSGQPFVVLPS